MAKQIFKNNAFSVLASGVTNVATSMTLTDASAFPAPTGGDWALATLVGFGSNGAENAWEIVKITAKASNTLTVVRAQEGTTAVAWGAATQVQMRLTEGGLGTKADLDSPTFTGTVSGITKAMVGLNLADNTSDLGKPISTATQSALNGKEPTITAGSTAQYLRGDKSLATFATDVRGAVLTGLSLASATVISATVTVLAALGQLQAQITLRAPIANPTFTGTVAGITKAMVGLGNVDNTSDAAKPVSTATQTALNAKQDTLVSGTNIKTINGSAITGGGNLVVGGGASGASSITGNTTLTVASDAMQVITPSGPGMRIVLPDATTMSVGPAKFTLVNAGAHDVEVRNNAGTTLGFIQPDRDVNLGLASISTAAGVWTTPNISPLGVLSTEVNFASSLGTGTTATFLGAYVIDADRELLLFGGDTRCYAVVWDGAANAFGTPALVRTASVTIGRGRAVLVATDRMLVVTCNATTGLEAVTLSISGTAITVNTAATATLGGNMSNFDDLIFVAGQAAAFGYRYVSQQEVRAISVSGTTTTIGSALSLTGDAGGPVVLFDMGSSTLLMFSYTAQQINLRTATLAASVMTGGGTSSIAVATTQYAIKKLASGRVAVCFLKDSPNTPYGAILTVASNAVSKTEVALSAMTTGAISGCVAVGSQVITSYSNGALGAVNVLTDSSGTAVAGTEISAAVTSQSYAAITDSTSLTLALNYSVGTYTSVVRRIGISGNNPTILASRYLSAATVDAGGYVMPTAFQAGKSGATFNVLVGGIFSVGGLNGGRTELLVSKGGLPYFIRSPIIQATNGGPGVNRPLNADNWEWSAMRSSTGLSMVVQKLKVA